jgi:alkylhydroperoxidase/carboxymuconolactone decarboxylase family protein YurZ
VKCPNLEKEGAMFDDIGDIRNTRKRYNVQMHRSGIKTFRELEELEANALKDGALAQKYKELIALGISINNGCYG